MEKKDVLRYGIIGFGNMGSTHAANLFKGKVPHAELAAICDTNADQLARAKALYPDIKLYGTDEEIINDKDIDAIVVAVPHYEHPPLAISALAHDKHVLIEKPAGVYTKQVLEMNEAAKKSNKRFGIMYNMRVNPVFQKVRELITSGQLGELKRVTWIITTWYRPQAYHDSATWRSTWKTEGGGTLINQNPHQLDLWQWLFGMPDKIHSFCEFGKYYNIEVEDEVVAYLKYNSGLTGVYITSTGETPGTNRLEIACDRGQLIVENNKKITFLRNEIPEREWNATPHDNPFAMPPRWTCDIPVDTTRNEAHVGIFKNFTRAALTGSDLLAPGEEGILGLTISNAIHYSAWTGKTVDVNNFPHDEFYDLLQDKIKHSTVQKKEVQKVVNLDDSWS